jgi:hypothetical protein
MIRLAREAMDDPRADPLFFGAEVWHGVALALVAERDEAIAHDRQPYPTAWAYEQLAAAHESLRVERDRLADQRDALVEAGKRWLSETGPGMHINTAKGRGMMRAAIASAGTPE